MSDGAGLKAIKSFEEQGPIVLWQVSSLEPEHKMKCYLMLDAHQKSFGVRLEAARSDDVKVGGAFVTQLRKHLPSGFIPAVFKQQTTGDFWIPFFTRRAPSPPFWIMLARSSPPEVRLVDAQGLTYVRKSSQGTYTKKRELGSPLPNWPATGEYLDILPELLAAWVKTQRDLGGDKSVEATTHHGSVSGPQETLAMTMGHQTVDASSPTPDLPEYQKTARDRLLRRLKTLRKSLSRLDREYQATQDLSQVEQRAQLLKQHMHTVSYGLATVSTQDASGQTVVIPLDPTLSPGEQLDRAFAAVKKKRRASEMLSQEIARTKQTIAEAEHDLGSLRAQLLPLSTVEAILRRHRLVLEKPTTRSQKGETPQALDFKTYVYRSDQLKRPVRILVGKGADGSDALVKAAKANDVWLHVVGGTGSHVIIPAQDLSGTPPPEELLRSAGILALFHSHLRQSNAGEVYVSRRQHIRKRKGMAPGLWQIDKAETTMLRFDVDELKQVLDLAAP